MKIYKVYKTGQAENFIKILMCLTLTLIPLIKMQLTNWLKLHVLFKGPRGLLANSTIKTKYEDQRQWSGYMQTRHQLVMHSTNMVFGMDAQKKAIWEKKMCL